jgi:hypothetical protein
VIQLVGVLVVLVFPVLLFIGIGLLTFVVTHGALFLFISALVLAPWFLFRSQRPPPGPADSGGGWGTGPQEPHDFPGIPPGGLPLPLPDAEPARVRLRDHDRPLRVPSRERRPAREPGRAPVRSLHGPAQGGD